MITSDRLLEHMEHCVKCGSCKATCPTYVLDTTEGMGARGRVMLVRALTREELEPTPLLAQRLYSCLLCGLCEPLCPVGVDVTGIVYHGLSQLDMHDPRGRMLRKLQREGFLHPKRTFGAGRALGPLLGPVAKKMGLVPFDIKLPGSSFRKKGMELRPEGEPVGRVAIFVGCAANYIYPQQGHALKDLLIALGYEVVVPEGEVCCGAPLRAMGMDSDAAELAKKNIEAFGALDADAVLSPCPTCTLAIKKHYPQIAGQAIENAMDPAEFLLGRVDHLRYKENPTGGAPEGVMYHEPCHLGAGLGAGGAPRAILDALGVEFTEPVNKTCCGLSQAGVYPEIADAQLDALSPEYADAGTLVTACPGCMAQLARRHGRVLHLLELLTPKANPGA
ncbi:MAG: (Fe-S)-binding protein [Thermodesulfovibrionales bacterium]|nr:(Fe-S)-binding protein [Thermodesulfovibrionales bacterium]